MRGKILYSIWPGESNPNLNLSSVRLTLSEVPCYRDARAEVAQLAEHSPEKAGVDSSILSLGTTLWREQRPILNDRAVPRQ